MLDVKALLKPSITKKVAFLLLLQAIGAALSFVVFFWFQQSLPGSDPLRRYVLWTFVSICVFDVVLVVVGLYLARRYLARPVVLVQEAARRIEAGDFGHSIQVTTSDELAGLARSFNEMAAARGRIEEALRESEERNRTLVEMSPDAIVVHIDSRLVFANHAALKLLGAKSPEEILGRPIIDFVHPDFRELVKQRVAQMESRGRTVPLIGEKFVRLDGSVVEVEVEAVRISYQGRPAVQVVARDITERIRQVDELRRIQQLVDNSQVVWFRWLRGPGWRSDLVSAGVAQFGYSPEDFIAGRVKYADIVHPDDLQRVAEEVRTHTASGVDRFRQEYRILCKDGDVRWIDDRTVIVRDETGGMRHYEGTILDCTDRKKAEEALKESEERYRGLFENASDIIYTHDLSGHFTSVNKAAERILGYTKAEALNMKVSEVVAPHHLRAILDLIERQANDGLPRWYDLEVVAKDGRQVFLEVSARFIVEGGRPVGVQGIARDVTEKRHAEEALRHTEKQLRQSQKMEAVGRLAGGIAHDFNNLLTAIGGYSDLILARLEEGHPLRRHATEIKKAGDRAASLTRQLLAFSRRQVLRPAVLNLNDVVSDMDEMLRRLIGEDIELRTDLDPEIGRIRADASQIEQILMNLALNARDAMPEGGRLTIRTANVDVAEPGCRQGPHVMLSITDTGSGMDAEVQAHIFEPFFTTKEVGKGTGLGLSTVYGIVNQSGGSIALESEPGKGSTFRIYLPRIEAGAERVDSDREVGTSPVGSEMILLVEDDEILRRMAQEVLETHGYQVLGASVGEEAERLSAGHTGPIHLMITDLVMPGTSGLELARRLRLSRPGLKLLFISGYTPPASLDNGDIGENAHFLQKPFSPDLLTRKVRNAIDDAGS